jgi:uncharacterized protein
MVEKLTVDAFYREAKAGKLVGLKCDQGHVTIPPRRTCRVCLSPNLEVVELSGMGKIITYTDVYSKSSDYPLDAPYTLALVNLVEGGNLFGVVLNADSSKISYGRNVRVTFKVVQGGGECLRPISPEKERPRIFFELSD